MTKTRYTVKTDGLTTIVHRIGPSDGPRARGTNPWLNERAMARRKASGPKRQRKKRSR
ncbi:MAG TPA: hypothetical protein VFY71_00275 [Planctomycetota bacterium]|nr:hypothetical protein [Planctomycetota bacterium]